MTQDTFHADQVRRLYDVTRRVASSEDLAEVLDAIAEGVTEGLGFGVAAISRLDGDQLLCVAAAGPSEVREQILGRRTPASRVLQREFSIADHWGILRYVPHHRQQAETLESLWVPDIPESDDPEDWHPLDTLYAPLYGPTGELLGNMAVDLPPGNKIPNAQVRELLEMFVVQAGIAMANAQRREQLRLRLRIGDAVRPPEGGHVDDDLDGMLQRVCHVLAEGTGADQVTSRCFEDPSDDHGHSAGWPQDPRDSEPLIEMLRTDLQGMSQSGKLRPVLFTDTSQPPELSASRERLLVHFEVNGWRRALIAPIYLGAEVMGYLVAMHEEGATATFSSEELTNFDVAGREIAHRMRDARLRRTESRLMAELQEVDRYKGELIATISHELKTPLTSIIGHTELLEDSGVQAGSVSAIARNAARLDRLVTNLLNYSRVQTSRETTRAPLDLVELCRATLEMLRVQAEAHGVTVQLVAPDAPVKLLGDAEELPRVLDNLCSNAVKYTRAGGEVTVTVTEDPVHAYVEVTDTGLGISHADQAHLFSAFHRSTNPDALTIPGTGLGLAISRKIAEAHGGRITVRSHLGHGSTFTLRVPKGLPAS